MAQCEQIIKVTIYPPRFPGKLNGTYAGFTIPQGYNNNTGQSVGSRYQYGGKYIGFRPNLNAPNDSVYYNGGNSFATRNCNIILNNFEDAKYFTENKTLHDFKNGFEVSPSEIQLSAERNSSTLGFLKVPIKDNQFLKEELNNMVLSLTPASRYMVVKFERDGISKNYFGRVEAYENQLLEIKIFDISDFYVKSTDKEGQTNKDQSSGDISKESSLFGGTPKKENIYFDWDSFNQTVEEIRSGFNNSDQSFPPTDKTMNEIKHKLINDFVTGSDKEQGIMYGYGVGYSKLSDYIAIGRPAALMRPFIQKGDIEQLRTYRMHGDLLDTLSSYFVYHMREPNQVNTMKVIDATNDINEKIANDANWCQTSVKDWGIGLFLIDPSELPQTEFKKFTTSAEEFGTGLDELFRTYNVEVKWRMELRVVDGYNRAILIPYTSKKEVFVKSDQIEKDFKITRNTEEHIALASAFRVLNKEHDGNSEYHALSNAEKGGFYDHLTDYESAGIYPYNSPGASENSYAIGKVETLKQETHSELDKLKERVSYIEYNCCGDNNNGGGGQGTGEFGNPVPGGTITQQFGCTTYSGGGYPICNGCTWHNGIDISGGLGTPILAADDGRVFFAGSAGGWGNLVKINHGDKDTWYAHLSQINVSNGANVTKGDVIGLEGSTGNSSGSHLHFGVHNAGESSWCSALNPNDYVQFGVRVRSTTPIMQTDEIVKDLPIVKALGRNYGEDNQQGWARFWNERSYLVENFNTNSNGADIYGGFFRMNLSETQDKLKSEALDYIQHIPQKAKTRLECNIHKFEKGQLPFWEIEPGDIFNVELKTCDIDITYKYEVFSVQYIYTKDKKEAFSYDYK